MAKDLKLDIPAGNFLANVTLNVPDEVSDNPVTRFFYLEGAKRFFQNGVLPKWEKSEAIRLGLWPNNAKGVPERPKKGYSRELIGFSKEGSEELFKMISDATTPVGGKATPVGVIDVNVSENSDYTGIIAFLNGWLASPNKDGSKRTVEGFAEKRGIVVPVEPWEEDNNFLSQVSSWYSSQD